MQAPQQLKAQPLSSGGISKTNFIKDEVVIRNADSGKGIIDSTLILFPFLWSSQLFEKLGWKELSEIIFRDNFIFIAETVMGLKGRRVHLIEEISSTVISFQRGIAVPS